MRSCQTATTDRLPARTPGFSYKSASHGEVSPTVPVNLKLKYAFRHLMKRNPLVRRWCSNLLSRERLEPEEHSARQRVLLRQVFRQARNVPAYANAADLPKDRDPLAHLGEAFPIIDKAEVLRRQTEFLHRGRMPSHRLTVAETSGTTGTPLDVYRSVNSMMAEEAFHLQHWHWAGWSPGQKQAVMRGDSVVPIEQRRPPYWFADAAGNQLFLSTRHLDRHNAVMFASELQRFGATQLRAYPSAAHDFAAFVEEAGLRLQLKSVVTGSEMLYPFQRQRIERVFGAKVFDFYGMAERVAFAAECEHGRMHVNPEYGVVEILDSQGRPTDEEGNIVGTTLHNGVMPLIRYRMNDTARWSREPCPCGRTYPVIEKIGGRLADQLYDLDGRAVNCTMIGFALDGMLNVRKAQVAQTHADSWVIRIVPGTAYSDEDGERILSKLAREVSPRVKARIELRREIPTLRNGKYKWVVQEHAW
jgi:phenylacetate-CoA ligase